MGYSPWGRKELNTTEQPTLFQCQSQICGHESRSWDDAGLSQGIHVTSRKGKETDSPLEPPEAIFLC